MDMKGRVEITFLNKVFKLIPPERYILRITKIMSKFPPVMLEGKREEVGSESKLLKTQHSGGSGRRTSPSPQDNFRAARAMEISKSAPPTLQK